MIGYGTLTLNNCPCLLSGLGTLALNSTMSGQVTMTGTGTLLATAATASGGAALLPGLRSIGGDTEYAVAVQNLPALTSTGGGGAYVPPAISFGYGNLPALVSKGLLAQSVYGSGAAELPALISHGGDVSFGLSVNMLPALTSFGFAQDRLDMQLFSGATVASEVEMVKDIILIISSTGTLVSSFVGTKILALELLSDLMASSLFSMSAHLLLEFTSYLTGNSINRAEIGTDPALDATSRVWVVNMDTFASSQYDDYGFSEFYTKDGISYGIAEDGIYELSGDTDNGKLINSLVDFGRSDLGSPYKKRVSNVYLGVGSSGKMYLKVDADEVSYTYEARSSSPAIKNHRVDIGKGLIGNYFDFTLINQDGCDFDLETITFEPIPLPRKI